jgi:phosphoenolpyruvate synthase/pyruvate phosphate dikinase
MTRSTLPSEWVPFLGEPRTRDASLVGPKASHLSALAGSHPVPAGFCITADAYRFAQEVGGMPREVAGAVRDAYERLVGDRPPGEAPPPVAVRSSAIDEDGPTASFAGQHDTILNVVGADAVLEAIERTWRSLRSDAALAYRRSHGLPLTGLALAVLVQRLVLADASGVAFSIDPVSGRRDRIVVNASWGLGESMVNGTVTPDMWTLDKASLAPHEVRLATKTRMSVAVDGRTREVVVPSFMRDSPSLDDAQVSEVAVLARSLEARQGWPVDIEFAFEGGRLNLLQCRPVTSAGREAA